MLTARAEQRTQPSSFQHYRFAASPSPRRRRWIGRRVATSPLQASQSAPGTESELSTLPRALLTIFVRSVSRSRALVTSSAQTGHERTERRRTGGPVSGNCRGDAVPHPDPTFAGRVLGARYAVRRQTRLPELRNVHDLEFDPVRVVEEPGVVPGPVVVLPRVALDLEVQVAHPAQSLVDDRA